MKDFVPYKKMSKKRKKAFDNKNRRDWSVFNMWLRGHQKNKEKSSQE